MSSNSPYLMSLFMYGYKESSSGTGILVSGSNWSNLFTILKVLVNVMKPVKPIKVLRLVSEVRI